MKGMRVFRAIVLCVFLAAVMTACSAGEEASVGEGTTDKDITTGSDTGLDWTKEHFGLEAEAIDAVMSSDGEHVFILSPTEVLAYSLPEKKIMARIPVEGKYDGLVFSQKDNALLLTSSAGMALQRIRLEFIQRFDLSGLPVKGPKDAPVTIVVFSDYQ